MDSQLKYLLYLFVHYACILVANLAAIALFIYFLPTILWYIIFGGMGGVFGRG